MSPKDEEQIDHQESTEATFHGHLELQDFMYTSPDNDSSSISPRRSTRLSQTTLAPPSQTSSKDSSPSPAKRKPSAAAAAAATSLPPKRPKRSRPPASYAPPSTYAHLPPLPDAIKPNLLILFVGLNPGIQTARTGHAYAHPSNLFWKLLFSSGLTDRLCHYSEDRDLPALYSMGFTNIVGRPSRNGAELSKQEMDDGVEALHDKARTWRPECMCIVGKSIWESIWRVRHGGTPVGKNFRYGWQDESENMGVVEGDWPGARVFVSSSTSGLAATLSPKEKEAIWNELGVWAKQRREERRRCQAEQEP
ncbi:G/U mismatch-specific uracil DNA glycosylase [Emericellopsis cladophorae]|uniref:G/U mismatch-specific uracil DNA glycosylase n=1 Tax=Emericellopsis cladophorae TaxID=2686198 RepID=A0A9Q0BGE5_9HYPO|nr:G/U mismatch-specific uracil DNA glycosylase [Emericellopsis cladophorae]KAI6783259.1 G/U mismatch-specific uracil DNA glycosylase [Emericellopsis cladophorae]